ncbi:hypothetical protein Syun_012212 [Stephania yunnanensis]|uniref:RRM domain-containing protein n=1 Tax=Stephania yunnanensis TaxID=152371 RepID=A0AAP0JZ59_9MAGN
MMKKVVESTRERHLHAIANEFGKSIKARLQVLEVGLVGTEGIVEASELGGVDDLREKMADIDNHVGEETGAKKGSCKGFAFIRYATPEQARKVLADLKDGAEVKGKRVGISLARNRYSIHGQHLQDMDKRASKQPKIFPGYKVLERLKNLGVEQIEEIYLPKEISTHSDAMSAFQRLQKPDALFGRDRSAQVAFSQSIHPSGAAVFTETEAVRARKELESKFEEEKKNLLLNDGREREEDRPSFARE